MTNPSSLLIEELEKYLGHRNVPEQYELTEYESLIISNINNLFIKFHSVQQVVYIDTPMALGRPEEILWGDLNDLLHNSHKQTFNEKINKIITREIVKGDTYIRKKPGYSEFDELFIYKREDGSEFDLFECATGIKAFAILQMLLKNGYLNKYTLLIIDEPEAHLHPQWIIEYARLIVLLNKHVGVKFFIASHNPDMVSAIKYISEAEGVDDKLNYYLGESVPGTYQYNYKHLGTDIEPIFESFNIALDRINLYGSK
ncbi:MAG: ATP-binding protein [Tannerellaceae bacterium]|nr:ATP-binding protein [Tannerellaceae bacterium]